MSLGAGIVPLLLCEIELVTDDCVLGCIEVALIHGDLLARYLKVGAINLQLLLIEAIVDPRQHGAGLDIFALVEGEIDDRCLNLGEVQHALMGLDIA